VLSELENAMNTFKKDIIIGAVNARTGKIIAEKLLKYLDDQIKRKNELIRKT
jgi:hypothetical protein